MKVAHHQWQMAGIVAVFLLALGLCGVVAQPRNRSGLPGHTNDTGYPIDLPTTLRLAGAQNLDIQLARASLNEAKANRESAVEQFFPWIAPGVGYHRRDGLAQAVPAGTVSNADFQSYYPGATLVAQMDLGDAIYKSLAARQLLDAAGHALTAQSQDSMLAAAQGYFDLARARILVDVVREGLRVSQDYQRQLHEAVGAGIAFKGDELRVQGQTEHDEVLLRQALEQQRVEAARLAQTLHLDSTVELIPLDTDLVPVTLIETNAALDSLVQQALRSRPELKQSQALLVAARDARKGTVYGPLIPSVGAQAFAGGFGGGPDHGPGRFGNMEDVLLGLSWRIGPGGLFDRGRIHVAEARLETVQINGEKVHDQIVREVVENHTRAQSLRDQLETTRRNLATATETLRLTQQRQQFGVGIVLENVQSQQDLVTARSNYATTVAEYNKSQYALRRAVGMLGSGTPTSPVAK